MKHHGHKHVLVALAGQPNCGKSTVFNMLTGAHQHVANFPGATVEKKEGFYREGDQAFEVVDLPGTYSLTSFSQEERVARDFLLLEKPEVVVAVADASNLERHLLLLLQLREMRVPLLLCLNMVDVAERRGIVVDAAALELALGVPVVPAVARRGRGREELRRAILRLATAHDHEPEEWRVDYGAELETRLRRLEEEIARREHIARDFSPRWLSVKLLEEDGEARRIALHHAHDGTGPELAEFAAEQRRNFFAAAGETASSAIAAARAKAACCLACRAVQRRGEYHSFTDAFDNLLCHRRFGLVFAALSLYAAFTLTFKLSDGWEWIPTETGWTSPVGACNWFFEDWLPSLFSGMREGPLRSMILDGAIAGAGGVLGFAPIIFFMFFFLAVIEDSGYIARVAFVLDRFLRRFGLAGNSVLPLIVSGGIAGGCAVPGVMAARTIRDDKDRLVTILVAPFMNCGAKIPVYAMLTAAFFSNYAGAMLWLMTALSWGAALLAARALRGTVVPGEQSPLLIELPPYHLPSPGAAVRSALQRSWLYVKKAGTLILAMSILLWAAMYFPRLDATPFERQRQEATERLRAEVDGNRYACLFEVGALERTDGWPESAAGDGAKSRDCPLSESEERSALEYLHTENAGVAPNAELRAAGESYAAYRESLRRSWAEEAAAQLAGSAAGRLGRLLEPITRLAGFDWRDNISLIGGFAAKEMVVGTMGLAYSLEDNGQEREDEGIDGHPLAAKLRGDARWSPLRALAFMLFVMLYAPCLPTVAVIARETGTWKWAAFAVVYSTAAAFVTAVAVFRLGGWLLATVG